VDVELPVSVGFGCADPGTKFGPGKAWRPKTRLSSVQVVVVIPSAGDAAH
jgi:hypothetical protein